MNKIILKISYSFLLIIFSQISLFAQSDYAKVQKLKSDYAEIEQRINEASTGEELSLISADIDRFRSTYSAHAELFDKALYPEKYQEMINNLSGLIALRETEFNKAEELNAAVSDLQQRVDTLNVKNNELQASLDEIKVLFDKSRKETANLNKTISELKSALQKRDGLVMNMVDSLMPPVMREKPMLSSEDKEQITSDIDKYNIIVNVKNTIRDNIKYLNLTSLQPEDLRDIQEQQSDFVYTWSRIGSKLAEVYSQDEHRSEDLLEIDSLFSEWTIAIENEAWQSIKEEFDTKGVALNNFSDGQEFVNSIKHYIDKEKKDIPVIPEEQAKNSFEEFADQTWKAEIEPKWTPFLIENGMLAEQEKETIEENIEVWRSELYPSNWWLWIIIIGIGLSVGMTLLLRLLKQSSKYDNIPES